MTREIEEDLQNATKSKSEQIKENSRNLRGKIATELGWPTDRFTGETAALLKFHGTYQQEDRDRRRLARQSGGQKQYIFMVRSKVPGGRLTPQQFLTHTRIGTTLGNGSVRITTRQDFQIHGVVKRGLRATIKAINESLVTTMGACGDIVRNVVTCPAPDRQRADLGLEDFARQITDFTLPKGRFYPEIWVDGVKLESPEPEQEPLYGTAYLPRKFKIGMAYPGDNCIDIYTNDLGFVPNVRRRRLAGFTLLAGGGLGMTHHKKETFPRLADPVAFIRPEQLLPSIEAVVGIHRDFGDRVDRRHARLKYVVAEMGVPAFRQELGRRLGETLPNPPLLRWDEAVDHLGWQRQTDDTWYLGLAIPSGRLEDTEQSALLSGLANLIQEIECEVRLTPQQNLLLCGIPTERRAYVEAHLRRYRIPLPSTLPNVVLDGLACPALPTCGLAITEAERVFPAFLRELNAELERLGLAQEHITVRMTGCPNGCARPYNAEIGLVGKTAGVYDVYTGGDFLGTRLSQVLEENVPFERLVPTLAPLLEAFRYERLEGEPFGDFCARTGRERRLELLAITGSA